MSERTTVKTCTKCGEEKPLEEYGREKRVKDGRQARCRECARAHNRAKCDQYRETRRAYAERNKDRIREYKASWHAKNSERLKPEKAKYYQANKDKWKQYQEDNSERLKEYRKQRWIRTRDKYIPMQAAYREERPHLVWEYGYLRRAEKYGFEPVIESFTRDELIAKYGDKCFHCGGAFEELDHFPVSVVKGGRHGLDNCVPSCLACNRRSWRGEWR